MGEPRARYAQRTEKILLALARKDQSADQLADGMRCGIGTVRATLLRLVQYGQVSREKVEDGVVVVNVQEGIERPRWIYVYTITDRGHARLDRLTE